jgi:hypothetical protein
MTNYFWKKSILISAQIISFKISVLAYEELVVNTSCFSENQIYNSTLKKTIIILTLMKKNSEKLV